MNIAEDDLRGEDIVALVAAHVSDAAAKSPPCSTHALGIEALRASDITFWTAREGVHLLGCGALRELDWRHVEIKSMRTGAQHLRKGVAAAILRHIIGTARARSYQRISLETGSGTAFAPARTLYLRFGFQACGPFGSYKADPNSAFMTLRL